MPALTRLRRARPTIGVLAGWQVYERTTINWFLEALLRGVMEGARATGCDLLLACGVGGRIEGAGDQHPAWPATGDDVHFVPVGGWNTDGLVVLSPLRTAARREHARREQAAGHPIVFVGAGDGWPAVEIDSAAGIRLAVEHLRGHGHSQLAFVAGDPLDEGDSALRLAAFRRVLPELGLACDERLVEPGGHSEHGGYEAMRAILERGRPFTAVVASNDVSAIGAMRALAEAGLNVPSDVAVVGFDDHLMASAHVPPLTSVRYPLAEAGRRAVELLAGALTAGRPLPETTAIPPLLVGRRSCGCLPTEPSAVESAPADATIPLSDAVAAEMAEAALRSGALASAPDAMRTCGRLLIGLQTSLRSASPAAFDRALIALLQQLEATGDRAHRWQPALSVLRRGAAGLLPAGTAARAEDLLHFARVAFSESADREGARQRLADAERADRVSALAVPLQSAQDEAEVLSLLEAHAPALGLRPVCLALYEPTAEDPVAWSRVLLLDGERPAEGGVGARLPTRGILPFRLRDSPAPRSLAVLPLVHHERTLGFVALDVDSLEPCAAVARPLAAALETVRLQAAVRALTVTDELTGLFNRRFFEQELRREAERARRFGRSVALVMVDVDHFKSYNDRFGHRAGDDALRGVAACLVGAAAAPRRRRDPLRGRGVRGAAVGDRRGGRRPRRRARARGRRGEPRVPVPAHRQRGSRGLVGRLRRPRGPGGARGRGALPGQAGGPQPRLLCSFRRVVRILPEVALIPNLKQSEVWFVTGSQHLYGPETLEQVAENSQKIAEALEGSPQVPCRVVVQAGRRRRRTRSTRCSPRRTSRRAASASSLWMHTFSPAKMWIGGLHGARRSRSCTCTPSSTATCRGATIDMDFMNLNQAAHGDREFGFICTRLRPEPQGRRRPLAGPGGPRGGRRPGCARPAAGPRRAGSKVARFGDNMREVAVTEGDKVEAQIQLRLLGQRLRRGRPGRPCVDQVSRRRGRTRC